MRRPSLLLLATVAIIGTVHSHPDAAAIGTVNAAKAAPRPQAEPRYDFKLLATNRTSTMEEELNRAAEEGFRFAEAMGGETLGGSEMVTVVEREASSEVTYEYRVLATSKTSTMEKEMNQAAAEGFIYAGQTIYESTFGGREVVVIMEKNLSLEDDREYLLLATTKTSTMEKELAEAGRDGFYLVGVTVAQTLFGGEEVVSILERQ